MYLYLGDIVKGLRIDLALEQPAGTALLAGTLYPGDTPDLRGSGAYTRRWAVLLAALIVS
jgi:hypothetical protein